MTDLPIHYFRGNVPETRLETPIPSAWYLNGELVGTDMSQDTFMRTFMRVHFDHSHWDGSKVMPNMDSVKANSVAKQKAMLETMIARNQADIDRYREELDKLG